MIDDTQAGDAPADETTSGDDTSADTNVETSAETTGGDDALSDDDDEPIVPDTMGGPAPGYVPAPQDDATILPPAPTVDASAPDPGTALVDAANAAYEQVMSDADTTDDADQSPDDAPAPDNGLIDGDTLVPMSHTDNGACGAYETDPNGNLLVPAVDVPTMLSFGFEVAA